MTSKRDMTRREYESACGGVTFVTILQRPFMGRLTVETDLLDAMVEHQKGDIKHTNIDVSYTLHMWFVVKLIE